MSEPGPLSDEARPAPVSSRHNPRFRAALALREARERRARGRILIDGARELARAVEAGHALVEAWVGPEETRGAEAGALVARLEADGVPLVHATAELLARLGYGDREEGVVGVAAMPGMDIADLALPTEPLVAVLEAVEKPGNLGAVARSADGAGVDALLVADPVSDIWNPNAIRASIGTLFSLPLATCSTAEALAFLRARRLRIVAADAGASTLHCEADLRGGVAIVLGSEARGLGATWDEPDVERVRIPMLGLADSLNVSASAAVLFYEARRQRGDRPQPDRTA